MSTTTYNSKKGGRNLKKEQRKHKQKTNFFQSSLFSSLRLVLAVLTRLSETMHELPETPKSTSLFQHLFLEIPQSIHVGTYVFPIIILN
jgi:hypothetical protein